MRRLSAVIGLLLTLVYPALALSPAQTLLLFGANTNPSLDLNLTGGVLPAGITFARASSGTYYDATGTMQTAATNVPRFDYGPTPGGVTNWQPNSEQPSLTNWPPNYNGTGATLTYAFGTEGGYAYMDVTFSGTATAASFFNLYMLTGNGISTSVGQTWYNTINVRLAAGSLTNFTALPFLLAQADSNSVGGFLGGGTNNTGAVPTSTVQTVSNTSTVTEVGTVTALPYLQFRTNPGPVSATFRISAHMLGTVPGALSTYVPTSGTPANVGATPLGLLIEEQRTNLAFPSVAWASAQAATGAQDGITLAAGTAPDATNTMMKFIPGTFSSAHQLFTVFSGSVSTTYTKTVFAKAAGLNFLWMSLENSGFTGTNQAAVFNLSNGTVSSQASNGSATITPTGNGIYRLAITATSSATGSAYVSNFRPSVDGNSFTGDGTSGVLLWGADLQAGAFATSYIPTTGAAATRAADTATMPVGPWYNPNAGTLAFDFIAPAVAPISTNFNVGGFYDNTRAAYIDIFLPGGGGFFGSVFRSDGAPGVYLNATSSTIALGGLNKVAGSYSSTAWLKASNGALDATAGASTVPSGITTLVIGSLNGGGQTNLNEHIRRVRYWPRAQPAAELQGSAQ